MRATGMVESKWVYRGDVASFDYDINDFTLDDTWRVFDLSGIIGTGRKKVSILMQGVSIAGGAAFYITPADSVNMLNMDAMYLAAAGDTRLRTLEVYTDVDGQCKYNGTAATWGTINVLIRAWRSMKLSPVV